MAYTIEDWDPAKAERRHARFGNWGFQSFRKEYVPALKGTPGILAQRAFATRDLSLEEEKGETGAELAKVLRGWQVAMMGTGMILGAGIFVSTGPASQLAGPAVILGFMVSGISALLSALCYSEFAVRYPCAGGAYNYLMVSCGELIAWLMVTTLILEYVLANAAVARAFSSYACMLFDQPSTCASLEWGSLRVDFVAGGLVLLLSILLMFTTAGGSIFSLCVTAIQLCVVVIVIVLGFTKANTANMDPFLPFGWRSILDAAGFVFFSFIGFDCVSTLAEEVKRPEIDMPVGIVGSISIVTVIYAFMTTSLLISVPYTQINEDAAFAAAMETIGYPWAKYLVAVGACMGITTGTLVGCMGVSRILAAVCGQHMFVPALGKISPRFNTPMASTAILCVATMPLAILSDLPMLINLVSAGTLMVFAVVAVALLWHRYNDPKTATFTKYNGMILGFMFLLIATGTAFGVYYVHSAPSDGWIGFPIIGGVHLLITVALAFLGKQNVKLSYGVPLFPFLPSISMLLNALMMASLPAVSYIQYLIFLAIMCVIYAVYSVQAQVTRDKHKDCPYCKATHMLEPKVVLAPGGSMLFQSSRIRSSLARTSKLGQEELVRRRSKASSAGSLGGLQFSAGSKDVVQGLGHNHETTATDLMGHKATDLP